MYVVYLAENGSEFLRNPQNEYEKDMVREYVKIRDTFSREDVSIDILKYCDVEEYKEQYDMDKTLVRHTTSIQDINLAASLFRNGIKYANDYRAVENWPRYINVGRKIEIINADEFRSNTKHYRDMFSNQINGGKFIFVKTVRKGDFYAYLPIDKSWSQDQTEYISRIPSKKKLMISDHISKKINSTTEYPYFEYRLFYILDIGVVSASNYYGGKAPQGAINLGEKFAEEFCKKADIRHVVVDVMEDAEGEYHVIEFNHFSSSGIYEDDGIIKIVGAMAGG